MEARDSKGQSAGAEAMQTHAELERFAIRAKLGEGGMGVVYEAYDSELQTNVALKTFHRFGPAQLYRLKQEFRALADLSHRNLVTLYELIVAKDTCYISMELIDGAKSFLEHVRPFDPAAAARLEVMSTARGKGRSSARADEAAPTTETVALGEQGDASTTLPTEDLEWAQPSPELLEDPSTTHTTVLSQTQSIAVNASKARFRGLETAPDKHGTRRVTSLLATRLDLERLRATLAQLCRGVHALHRMGKLHRDLKPRNVLVAGNHRVVICDFGLVTEAADEKGMGRERLVEGTLAYMSPEQACGQRLGFASDWFAVGVMLYEALTARRPFAHRNLDTLRAAHEQAALVPPSLLVPGTPDDLDRLCCELLAIDPDRRPRGAEILSRLGEAAASIRPSTTAPSSDRPLIGRTAQLTALFESYDATRKGNTVVHVVRGAPGMGKTALASRFLGALPNEVAEDLVTLTSRCYSSESVPFNAIDGLIDALSGYFKNLEENQLRGLLADGIDELARLFPVLQRVDEVATLVADTPRRSNEQEQRRQAFAALTEILRRLAADRSLVLFIDNFQYCDRDSARLLVHILDAHPSIPLLLIACEKHQERSSSWFMRQLGRRKEQGTWSSAIEVREMTLAPLSLPQSRALARLLLDTEESFQIVERVVKEAAGNPLYVEELLAAWTRRSAKCAALPEEERAEELRTYAERMTIERVLLERTHSLGEDARALLRTAAVAGRPMPQGILYRAAGLGSRSRQAANTLRIERLVRAEGLRETDRIEIAHDGLRAAVLSTLSEDATAERHRRLASAMVAVQSQDHEAMAEHWKGANERTRARAAAVTAAERAAHTLAFDRATRLFRMALDLRVSGATPSDGELRRRLAEVLASSGHALEAAGVFLSVARGGTAADAIECRRHAAELYFQSGCIDEGFTALYEALDQYGLHLPRGSAKAGVSHALHRLRIRTRNYRFDPLDESEVPEVEHKRSDLCASVLLMMGFMSGTLGAQLQARDLLRSLEVGETKQLARAMSLEPMYRAARGARDVRREQKTADAALELAEQSGDPSIVAFAKSATSVWHYLRVRMKDALATSEEAIALQERVAKAGILESNTVRLLNVLALYYCGRVEEFVTRVRSLVQDAEIRGDSFMLANLCAGIPATGWLLVDDTKGANWSNREALSAWPTRADRHIQGYWEAFSVAQVHLYSGEKGRAWNGLEKVWPQVASGAFMHADFLRAEAWHLRGRCAIDAAAAGTREQARFMRESRRAISALRKSPTPISSAWAKMIKAGLRVIEGDRRHAIGLLTEAETDLTSVDMKLYAAAARWRRGELLRSSAGEELIADAESWLLERRISKPQSLVACLVPGFPTAHRTARTLPRSASLLSRRDKDSDAE